MKRNMALVLLAIAVAVCLVSCSNDVVQNGTLFVKIDSSISRGLQAISMETSSYNVTIRNSSNEIVLDESSSTQTSYSISVPVGTYTVAVEALNEDGIVIGTGSTTGFVSAGQTTAFTVTVSELSGNGTLSISITANEGYELSYSIKNAAGTEIEHGALAFSDGTYSKSVELSNGFYSFSIVRNDTNKVLKTDAVRIIKGRVVSYEAEFLILTDGSISIINEILRTPQISLELSSKSLKSDATLSAAATITGISNYTCYWAVDEVPLSEAGDYADLELSMVGLTDGTHTISLFVSDGTVVWSESSVFSVIPERPTEIEVGGDVELWFIGDVLIPWDFKVDVEVGRSGYQFRPSATRGTAHLDAEGEKITIQSVSDENYYAYLDYKYDAVKERTVVYIILDRFIESPGYIEVIFPELETEDFSMGVWFDADTTVLNPNATSYNYRCKGLVTVMSDTASRVVKVEPDTYRQNGTCGYLEGYELSLDRTPFEVKAGETKQSTWEIIEYTTFVEVEVPDVSIYPEFAELVQYISFSIGENGIGGWSNQYLPSSTSTYTTELTEFGEDLPVMAKITMKDMTSENALPYKIVPSVEIMTVEEGNTYSVKFMVVEKPKVRLIVSPIDAEFATQLEGTRGYVYIGNQLWGWGQFDTAGWDHIYYPDFNEGDVLSIRPWVGYQQGETIYSENNPACRLVSDKDSITISADDINVITIQVLPLE